MRVGFNPNKDKERNDFLYSHQVIIPVYIPNHEGYFKDSLEILKICLMSLHKTSHAYTYITVVNNGSSKQVLSYLNQLYEDGIINELINTEAIGKLNAILKGIVGHKFKLITVSDADVFFSNNWQKGVYKVFSGFPKVGAVCTTPSSKSYKTHTSNIWLENLFSSKLRFTKVKNVEALKMFASSIGNSKFYNQDHLEKYLTITHKNNTAVVGAGHFVTTYRSDVFDSLNSIYSNYALGGNSEMNFLDIPVIRKGYWRLSTIENYTYHMGNVYEDWMQKKLNNVLEISKINDLKVNLHKPQKQTYFIYFIKNKLFFKYVNYFKCWEKLLKFKGLDKKTTLPY